MTKTTMITSMMLDQMTSMMLDQTTSLKNLLDIKFDKNIKSNKEDYILNIE